MHAQKVIFFKYNGPSRNLVTKNETVRIKKIGTVDRSYNFCLLCISPERPSHSSGL